MLSSDSVARPNGADMVQEWAGATQAVLDMFALAHQIHPDKECGCERCAGCTEQLVAVLAKAHRDAKAKRPVPPDIDRLWAGLEKLVSFPKVLHKMVELCLELSDGNSKSADGLGVKLKELCEDACTLFSNGNTLPFARVAYVLELHNQAIKDLMAASDVWTELKPWLEKVAEFAAKLPRPGEKIPDKVRVGKLARNKRVCGGGRISLRKDDDVKIHIAFVMDFSTESILCMSDHELEYGKTYTARCSPCERDLSFDCKAVPIRTTRSNDSHLRLVEDPGLAACAKYFCVLTLSSIRPFYYYWALCNGRRPNHPDLEGERIADRYDWLKSRPAPGSVGAVASQP
jgi:hypothetical protein